MPGTRSYARFARTRATLASAALAAALALHARRAPAQEAAGWAVDRAEPAPAGDAFFQTHFPVYAPRDVAPAFALVNTYAFRPLIATVRTSTGTTDVTVIEHLLATHAQVNVHLAQRLGLDVSLPIYWLQSGATDATLPVRAANSVSLGDVRLGARVRIVGNADRDAGSLHVGATAHLGVLGSGSRATNTSDGGFRARLFVVAPAARAFCAGRSRRGSTRGPGSSRPR
jgi:hypothetical protein